MDSGVKFGGKYKWVEHFLNVKVAFIILIISIFIYFIIIDIEGGFSNNFLHFGPTDTSFMRMTVDTWSKVMIVYFIGFLSSVMISYYQNVSDHFISNYIHSHADKNKVKLSKGLIQFIYFADQIIYKILVLFELFVNITLELQFILPGLFGKLVVDIPYGFYLIDKNKSIKS